MKKLSDFPNARQRLNDVTRTLREQQAELDRALGARDRVREQLADAKDEHERLTEEVEVLELTQALAIALEGQYRKAFEQRVSDTCSDGLSLVFKEGMELRIVGSTKNGQSAADFVLETGEGEANVMTAEGGSVVQVVSFLLRVLFTVSHTPQLRNTMLLDEAFNGVDANNIPAIAVLLRKLVDEGTMQILMSTHNMAFIDIADMVHEVTRKRTVAKVECIKSHNDNHLYDEDVA